MKQKYNSKQLSDVKPNPTGTKYPPRISTSQLVRSPRSYNKTRRVSFFKTTDSEWIEVLQLQFEKRSD
jgi:hypothetical protein